MQPSPLKPEEIERKLQITVLEGGGGPLSEILLLQIVFYEESFSTGYHQYVWGPCLHCTTLYGYSSVELTTTNSSFL